MTFDVTWFGYGAGLVMCGWIAGNAGIGGLNVLGRMGKLGAFVLVGRPARRVRLPTRKRGSNLAWVSSPVTTPGVPYTVGVQVTCTGDSFGSVLGGSAPVSYACPGSVGSVQVNVEVPAPSGSTLNLAVMGDAAMGTASVVSAVPGNTVSSGVSFICGVATVLAFAWAAGGRWL